MPPAGLASTRVRLGAAAAAALVALLAAASAGAAERPVGDGAWSWFGDPRAVTDDGHTYVGTARKRGRRWVVRDGLARLRPGRRCVALGPRIVSCRAAGVRRIVMYGGAGNDRMTVIGRIAVTFHGGPGRDVTRRIR